MIKYIKELRVSNYVKNLIIALPLICGNSMLDKDILLSTVKGFAVFCLLSSSAYVFNDIFDRESDRYSPNKSLRPVSAGQISTKKAAFLCAALFIVSMVLEILFFGIGLSLAVALSYFILSVLYCMFIKRIPYLECICVSSFYIFRLYYGSAVTGIPISLLLLLTVTFVSVYFCLGKRYAELQIEDYDKVRSVLKHYSGRRILALMYVTEALSIICYIIWAHCSKAPNGAVMPFTAVIVFLLFTRYNHNLRKAEYGDPVYLLFSDYVILSLSVVFALILIFVLYFPTVIFG